MSYGDYPDCSQVKNILVIKLRQLGDVLLATPVLSVLKKRFPNAKIDAYIYQEAHPILQGHPGLHRCWLYPRIWKSKNKLYRGIQELVLWWRIRQANYDLVINLTEGDRGIFAGKISGAPICVGFAPKGKIVKKWLTHVVKSCPTLRHAVERNLDALRRIGVFPSIEEKELFFHIPPSVRLAMKEKLGDQPFIIIHPTARWGFKTWPVDQTRGLIRHLISRGKKVVITSGSSNQEREKVELIKQGLDVVDLSGTTSLKELGALIESSQLLICVDSFAFHLANALKKPVIALFGPTSEITWGIWKNPYAKIVAQSLSCRPCHQDGCGGSKVSDCLETLSLDQVLREVDSII